MGEPSGGGFGEGGELERTFVLGETTGHGLPGFGEALSAAGAEPGPAAHFLQPGRAFPNGGADVAVGYCFADAYDHRRIVNANTNDCQSLVQASGKSFISLVLCYPP
jgi:hypothetical protein